MGKKSFLKNHPFVLHLLIALALSLLIIVIVFAALRRYGRVGQEYPTPCLVGTNVDELQQDELELVYVVIDSVYQQGRKGGYILRQDPDTGSMIKKGRKIYLTVASYRPDNAVMPDLRSLSVRHAISQLENVGLSGGKLVFVDDPHHVVLEQRYKGRIVAEGRQLDKGALVDLTVGLGTGKTQTIVPYVVGMSPSKARREILSSSLNVGIEHYDGISNMSQAIVYRQSPGYTGRSDVSFGSAIELWYCDKSVVAMEELERLKQRKTEDSLRALSGNGESFELIGLDEF